MTREPTQIDCPACGETVKQVASATLSLALWQHYNWTCKKSEVAALHAEREGLREALMELLNQWRSDTRDCFACTASGPCETCMQIARCIGALEGTIQRAALSVSPSSPPQDAPKRQREP